MRTEKLLVRGPSILLCPLLVLPLPQPALSPSFRASTFVNISRTCNSLKKLQKSFQYHYRENEILEPSPSEACDW